MNTIAHILALSTIIGSAFILSSCGSKSSNAASQPARQGSAVTVNGVILHPQPLDNVVRSSGTVLASESVDLIAEAAGRIEKIFFKEGSHVKKDELLVKINDDDLRAQLKKTELQIQLAVEQ